MIHEDGEGAIIASYLFLRVLLAVNAGQNGYDIEEMECDANAEEAGVHNCQSLSFPSLAIRGRVQQEPGQASGGIRESAVIYVPCLLIYLHSP